MNTRLPASAVVERVGGIAFILLRSRLGPVVGCIFGDGILF